MKLLFFILLPFTLSLSNKKAATRMQTSNADSLLIRCWVLDETKNHDSICSFGVWTNTSIPALHQIITFERNGSLTINRNYCPQCDSYSFPFLCKWKITKKTLGNYLEITPVEYGHICNNAAVTTYKIIESSQNKLILSGNPMTLPCKE